MVLQISKPKTLFFTFSFFSSLLFSFGIPESIFSARGRIQQPWMLKTNVGEKSLFSSHIFSLFFSLFLLTNVIRRVKRILNYYNVNSIRRILFQYKISFFGVWKTQSLCTVDDVNEGHTCDVKKIMPDFIELFSRNISC